MCQKRKKNIGKITPPYEFCLLLTTLQNQFSPHIQYIPLPLCLPVQRERERGWWIPGIFILSVEGERIQILLNYWMDLLQIFRNYFLGFLYLHDTPLSVCLSVKKLDRTSPPKLLDGFTSNFQELLLRIPIFACSSVVRLSVCQNT